MALFAPFHTFDSILTSPFSHSFHRRRRFCAADPFRLAARMDNPFVQFVLTDDAMDTDAIVRFDPEVSETDEGFLVSALVPGVRDEDLAITAEPERGVLTVRSEKHPHVRADLRLPTHRGFVDASNISASCIDGVLRIIVPKVEPSSELIRVDSAGPMMLDDDDKADDKADPDEADEADEAGETIVINVPGFSRHDISISRKRPAETLLIEGASTALGKFGKFRKTLTLARADARVKAWCSNGLLTIRVVNPHTAGVHVPVSATPLKLPAPGDASKDANEEADDEPADGEITLMRRAVPGVSARDFSVEIDAKNTLTARADASTRFGRRRYSFSTTLPKNVDKGTVAAEVVDGILSVVAAKPAPPARITVTVSGDVPASLPSASDDKKKKKDATDKNGDDDAVPVVEVDGMVEDVAEDDDKL